MHPIFVNLKLCSAWFKVLEFKHYWKAVYVQHNAIKLPTLYLIPPPPPPPSPRAKRRTTRVWEPFPRYSMIIKIGILGYFFFWGGGILTEVAYGHFLPPWGWNWACFRSTGSGFWDTGWFSKLPYLGMKTGIWKSEKVPEVAYGPSFYPRRSKWSLFSLYGQWFPGRFWKLPYLGMKTGIWKKCQKLHMHPLSTPGVEILFSSFSCCMVADET